MGWRTGQSYSQDLRDRVLGAVDGGLAVRQVAVLYQVSIAYIYKARIRRRLTGDSGINPSRGHAPRKLTPEQELALDAHIRSYPGITLIQAQAWLQARHDVRLSIGGLWTIAKRLGLSFKKSHARRRAGQAGRGGSTQNMEGSPALYRSR
jgi:transposase